MRIHPLIVVVIIVATFLFPHLNTVHGQTYVMNGTPIVTCGGTFFDPGGASGDYANNLNLTTTICSDGSEGTHVRIDFSGITLGSGDLLCFYDGTDAGAPQLGCSDQYPPGPVVVQATAVNPSGCLTLVFTSDNTESSAGWSAILNCVPSCQQVLADLVSTVPAAVPADTGWIDICPGSRVSFTSQGLYPQNGFAYAQSDLTTSFEWNFGDGGIAYGPEVSHVFDEEGGYYVQLVLTDAQGCRSTNLINQRIRVAPDPDFRLQLAFDNSICVNDTVQLSAGFSSATGLNNLLVTPNLGGFATGGSRSDSLALPDGTGIPYATNIYFTEFSPGQILTNSADLESICVNMEHSYLRDMEIKITCPNGTEVILHNFGGQSGGGVYLGIPNDNDNFNPVPGSGFDYCWTSNAPNPTWLQYVNTFPVQTLPPGDYSTAGNLDDLLGCPLNGEWELTVTDLWPADNGYIFSWGINFNPALYPQLETFDPGIVDYQWRPQSSIYFASPDSIAASPQFAGSVSYVFSITDGFGCTWDTTLRVNVLPATHPECFSCQNQYFALRDTAVCGGSSVQLNGGAVAGPNQIVRFQTEPDYRLGNANHPHVNPYFSPISVSSLGFNFLTDPINQIESVCMDVETDFCGDLNILLRAPDNKVLMLSTGNGGSGDNYKVTCFTPSATLPIVGQAAPFNGTYQPEGAWSALNNAQVNGDWRLQVSDGFGPNQFGRVKSWTIAFKAPNNVNYTWTPAAGLSCANCPNPIATPTATTNYFLTAVDNFNCAHRDTVTIASSNFFPAPDNLAMTNMQNGAMTWAWNAVPGVSTYEINVNNTGWVTVNGTTYTVTGLTSGQNVAVLVRAVGGSPLCPPAEASAAQVYVVCTLDATVNAVFPTTCPGATNGAVDVVVNGQQGTTVFYTNFGSNLPYTNGNLTFFPAGTWRIWAVDASGCRDTVSFTITQPDTFATILTTTTVACNGGDTGSATISATGGTGTLTYTWQRCTGGPTSNGTVALNLSAGNYCVTVQDQIGCSTTRSVTVGQNPPFSFTTSQDSVRCFGTATGSATITPSGATAPYTYFWENGATTGPLLTGLAAGFRSVTVTDALGCQAVSGVFIGQPAALVIDSLTNLPPGCTGQNNGEATAFVRGGTGGYNYVWSGTTQVTQTIENLAAGTYTLTVTDAKGCTAIGQTTLVAAPPLLLTLQQITNERCTNACNGGITLVPSGGVGTYTLDWDAPTVPDNTLITNTLCPGDYQVTLSDQRGCTVTERFDIIAAIPLDIRFNAEAPDCPGDLNGQITALPDGGVSPFTYVWSTGAVLDQVSGLSCGAYTITVTDGNNCTKTAVSTLTCPPPIQITNINSTPVRCFGESNGILAATAIGGSGQLSFRWSDNNQQNNATANNLQVGIYTVTVTDSNQCSTTSTASVAQPQPLTAFATPVAANCIGQSTGSITATPAGGNTPYSYIWSGIADTDNQVQNILPGTYSVTVTDTKGCTTIVPNIVVSQPATPMAMTLTQTQASCFDTNSGIGLAAASGSNGAPFTYAWSSGASTAQANNLASGTYTVTATDNKGCTTTQTVNIARLDSIAVNIILVPPTCFGLSNGIASVNDIEGGSGNGITANYTIQWSLPGSPTGVAATGLAGEVPFTLVVSDQQGCNNAFTFSLTQPPPVVPILAATDVRCHAETNGAIQITQVQGQNPITGYLWSNQSTTNNVSNLAIGTYTVTTTDSRGCTGTASATIAQPTPLDIAFEVVALKCHNDANGQISTSPTGGITPYTLNWNTSAPAPDPLQLTNLSAGNYIVTLTDANNCQLIDSQAIAQPPLLNVQLATRDVLCHDTYTGRVELSLSGGRAPYQYALNDGDFGGTPIFIGLEAGDNKVRIRDANGCAQEQNFEISQPDPITINLTPQDATVTYGDQLSLGATANNATGPVTFRWVPQLIDSFKCVDASCFAITLTPYISNTFKVLATDANGCLGEARVSYEVEKPRGVYVPTGFTPNQDNTNDLLQVFGKGRQTKAIRYFRVFDRWGELLYEDQNFNVNDTNRGWDGRFRGEDCLSGVYVWTLEVEYLDGFTEQYYGQSTLIR
jgi:gliding motility-associated-like protein